MSPRPSAKLRSLVYERANGKCEYCLIPEDISYSCHQLDHIISLKHGGKTTLENLALSCILCNRRKGSDISSIDPKTGKVVSLFNPRKQLWEEHFSLRGLKFIGLTPYGNATVSLLEFNLYQRQLERSELIKAGVMLPRKL